MIMKAYKKNGNKANKIIKRYMKNKLKTNTNTNKNRGTFTVIEITQAEFVIARVR